MKASEPQYRRAWDELHRSVASPPSPALSTWRLDEELRATKAELEATRQQVHNFIRNTRAYQQKEMAVHRQELRAQWVLEQLHLIETGPEAADHDLSAIVNKKRKLRDTHDSDNSPPRGQPKGRKREASHSSSVPELKSTPS
ncbi:hypothetical protein GQX73_g10707 [Xylaria multiplex]|uniref:Uncharacterized protein n=1 Tax=Xylaria multiplex TaxID=323545 RepID=A0A7C8ISH1_9PEZI|nr:hypothetical protein GQX73_g10707 [Xylaria multiplex]